MRGDAISKHVHFSFRTKRMNIDRQDVQDVVKSLIDSLLSQESFVFEFRNAKMDQQADLDSSRLQIVNNLGRALRSERTTDDFS